MTTHSWFSRRIHRLLKFVRANSTYEEVLNRDHWWWDTKNENDGGVLNDKVMRKFYRVSLLKRLIRLYVLIIIYDVLILHLQFCKDRSIQEFPQLLLPDRDSLAEDQPIRQSPKCSKDLRLVATDLSSQGPLCGMQILQRFRQTVNSVVNQKCFKVQKSKIKENTTDYLPGK